MIHEHGIGLALGVAVFVRVVAVGAEGGGEYFRAQGVGPILRSPPPTCGADPPLERRVGDAKYGGHEGGEVFGPQARHELQL